MRSDGVRIGPEMQEYLLEARQMQALSLGVHIPLVCFGIAFPAMVLFAEGLWLRTGDPAYKALAKRWSKVMLILFAIGVVTGTILSFELGLLWPRFMEQWGEVFGVAFALEGASFFVEAIFIAIYVYGWDRLSPRAHILSGIPIVIAGFTGAAFVISVNGWMNNPSGFEHRKRRGGERPAARGTLQLERLARADPHVSGGLPRRRISRRRRLRLRSAQSGKRGTYYRAGLVIPLAIVALAAPAQIVVGDWAARTIAEEQPTKLAAIEGLDRTTDGADLSVGGIYIDGRVYGGVEIPEAAFAPRLPRPERKSRGARRRAPRRPAADRDRPQLVPGRWSESARSSRRLRSGFCGRAGAGESCRDRSGSCARSSPRDRSRWWR